ncbi:MAG: MBL fold metallo-hydrolase [Bacillota bacterium]|jgi:L-ascorbate metabolism protein UlaG (beta-lactamase superfamily)
MKVRYIGHSGFLVEWDACYWLFDYFTGDIPQMDTEKKLFVFVSHSHGDHFSSKVLDLRHKYPNIEYVLSSDIEPPKGDWVSEKVTLVNPEKRYEFDDGHNRTVLLKTLKSTDMGVAFLLSYLEKTVYHAGDLNLWVWKEETQQYNDDMTAAFSEQMNHLRGIPIDIAFVPLDPRQEEYYHLGLEALLNTTKVKRAFPMHFGREVSVIERYKREREANLRGTVLMDIERAGQEWEIDL